MPGYRLFTLAYMGVFVVVGLGMRVLVGDSGLVSLGHAGFMAVGAYATVAATALVGVPFPLALFLGSVAAACLGLLVALPALRLEGPYLAIVTFGFGVAVPQLLGGGVVSAGTWATRSPKRFWGLLP